MSRHVAPLLLLAIACATPDDAEDTDIVREDTDALSADSDTDVPVEPVVYDPWPFVGAVVSFDPGEHAGFGQDRFPDIVLGSPEAPGAGGSLDVLSLGDAGEIVVAFDGLDVVDGPGVDLIVFENPFPGWLETGVVGVSEDGETWTEWPCDSDDAEGGFPGCAGVAFVHVSATNGVDATDHAAAGGDGFDLSAIGATRARYVRIRDSGANSYDGVSGGFDLDAVAVVHGEAP